MTAAGPGSPPDRPAARRDGSEWPAAVLALLERTTFPAAGAQLTCAVSGGADSMALLALAVAAGCEVTAVHVDHGLRAGGASEAALVADVARGLGAAFRSVRVEVAEGPNLEERARRARFAALPPGAATGHTMDDQAETVLLNLLRGAGVDGLAGMRAGSLHPLLPLRRAETRLVCSSLGITWVEDPSNTDPAILRNRVRRELLPLCNELSGRDVVPVLARQAALLAEEAELLESLSRDLVPDPVDGRRLAEVPRAVARRALRRWLRDSGNADSGNADSGNVDGRDGDSGSADSGNADGRNADGRVGDPTFPERARADHPPSLAEVDRVLDVARGLCSATELRSGRRVSRSKRRLRLDGGDPRADPGATSHPASGAVADSGER